MKIDRLFMIHLELCSLVKERRIIGKKFLFRVDYVEIYSNSHLTSIVLRINNYQINENEDRAKIMNIIHWYMKIWEFLLQTVKILPKV